MTFRLYVMNSYSLTSKGCPTINYSSPPISLTGVVYSINFTKPSYRSSVSTAWTQRRPMWVQVWSGAKGDSGDGFCSFLTYVLHESVITALRQQHTLEQVFTSRIGVPWNERGRRGDIYKVITLFASYTVPNFRKVERVGL